MMVHFAGINWSKLSEEIGTLTTALRHDIAVVIDGGYLPIFDLEFGTVAVLVLILIQVPLLQSSNGPGLEAALVAATMSLLSESISSHIPASPACFFVIG